MHQFGLIKAVKQQPTATELTKIDKINISSGDYIQITTTIGASEPEMEPGLRITGQRISDFGRIGSGHGSVCQTRCLSRF